MLAVTADTNIWVSAFNYHGNPRRLIDIAHGGEIEVAVSKAIINETRRILDQRFDWALDRIDIAEAEMRAVSNYMTPVRMVLCVCYKKSVDQYGSVGTFGFLTEHLPVSVPHNKRVSTGNHCSGVE